MQSTPKDRSDAMPLEHLPPPAQEAVTGGILAALWAFLGALAREAHDWRTGKPLPLSRRLGRIALLLPVSGGMGIMGAGLADWLGLTGNVQAAFIAWAGFIGPQLALEGSRVATEWARNRAGGGK